MKKNTVFEATQRVAGVLAILLTFAVLLTACSKKAEAQTGGDSASGGDSSKAEAKSTGGKEAPASDFDYELTADSRGVEISNYKGMGGNVVIPAAIEGMPVLSIGKLAFSRNEKLTAVSIPSSVERIKGELLKYADGTSVINGAFYQCSSLTKVEFSEGLKEIAMYAFMNCKKLTTVNLPASIERIENSAFFGCSELINLSIADTLASVRIENYVFADCKKLPLASQKRLRDLGYTGQF